MKDYDFEITQLTKLAPGVFEMHLVGVGSSAITAPGQFINIKIDGKFLRRPISVCDKFADEIAIVFKVVGAGTRALSGMRRGDHIVAMSGLGNGFTIEECGPAPLIIGGGVGVPPLYMLAKQIVKTGKRPRVVLGFNTASEIILDSEFERLGCGVDIATLDGSAGTKGFVTSILPNKYSYFYACGPEPMLRAVYNATGGEVHRGGVRGQMSFEARMGCGFGACMGCSCHTISGSKRICKDGPVLRKEEIVWAD